MRRRSDGRTTDIKVLGRAQTDQLKWSDLFRNPEPLRAAGEIDQVHTMFQLDAVLDEKNGPKAARWRLGQILYARSARSHHYGYEIILNSLSGVMLPTT